MPRARIWMRSERWAAEDGSASLEFVTAALILLVPLVYLVIAVSVIQGGALAAEGAARQAARVFVQAPDVGAARAAVDDAVTVALADAGSRPSGASVLISCENERNGCLSRRNEVTVTLRLRIALPLMPDVLSLREATSIPIQSQATQTVSRFWGAQR